MKRFVLVLANIAFHEALWESSKSQALKRQLTPLLPYLVYIERVVYLVKKDVAESVVDSHQTLLNLISGHKPNYAGGYSMGMNLWCLERLNGFEARNGG